MLVVNLRLGALIPRSVGLSVCLSGCLSSKNYKKITKLYKTLKGDKIRGFQPNLSLMKTVKEASAICRSFLDGFFSSKDTAHSLLMLISKHG